MSYKQQSLLTQEEHDIIETIRLKHIPDFHSLSKHEQNLALAENEGSLARNMTTWFFETHHNYTPKFVGFLERDKEEPRQSPEQVEKLNIMSQYLVGIGDCKFRLNEFSPVGEHALTYKTLREYDEKTHALQQKYREQFTPEEDYFVNLHGMWARYINNENGMDRLHYTTIMGIRKYLEDHLFSISGKAVNNLIPNHRINGPDMGKRTEDGGYIHDRVTVAFGLEEEYEKLNKFAINLTLSISRKAADKCEKERLNLIWKVTEESILGEEMELYVFSDSSALDVRFTHWMEDTRRKAPVNNDKLKKITDKSIKDFKNQVTEEYNRIMINSKNKKDNND